MVAQTEPALQEDAAADGGVHAPPGFLAWVAELVHLHRHQLLGYARRRGLDAEDALDAVQESFVSFLRLPEGADVLGPVPAPGARGDEVERALLRVAPGQGTALASALKAAQIARLALRTADPVRIRIDPSDIG